MSENDKKENEGQNKLSGSESELKDLLFCDECKWLSPTEAEQDEMQGYPAHLCTKIRSGHIRLVHGKFHPKILRSKLCPGYE